VRSVQFSIEEERVVKTGAMSAGLATLPYDAYDDYSWSAMAFS
jgi:hypothetical protein